MTSRKDDDTTQPIENNSTLLESLLQAQEDIERLNKTKVGFMIDSYVGQLGTPISSTPREYGSL